MEWSDIPDGPSAVRYSIKLGLFKPADKPTIAEARKALQKHVEMAAKQVKDDGINDQRAFFDLID